MGLMNGFSNGIAGQLAGQFGSGVGNNKLLGAVAKLVGGSGVGGLSGLTQLFMQGGYGDTVKSWISTDKNRDIPTPQLQDVLGQERIREVANEAGVTETEAADGLAEVLPQLVDKLTPDGKLPENNSSNSMLAQLASQFLGASSTPGVTDKSGQRS